MDQGILCPRQTSAPQSHTLKETGIRGHSVSAQTQRWVAERQKSNSASIKLWSTLACCCWRCLTMPHFQSCFFHSNLQLQLKEVEGSVAICKGGSRMPHNKMAMCVTFDIAASPAVDTDHRNSMWWVLWQGKDMRFWEHGGKSPNPHL